MNIDIRSAGAKKENYKYIFKREAVKAIVQVGVAWLVMMSACVADAQTDAMKAEHAAAVAAAIKAAVHGPSAIPIFDEATLALPAGDQFIPASFAIRLLRSMGQPVNEKTFVGMVMPNDPHGNWVALLNFFKDGYVRDDDAKHWNADALLRRLSESTARSNPERKSHGFPELAVLGWEEAPTYDAATHRMVWGTVVRKLSDPDDSLHRIANYQTVALGRDGHLDLMLASSLGTFAADKTIAGDLLDDVDYRPGKHYADFDKFTDHVAEYGLAALVLGVTAKKLGLLAVVLAFLAKFSKLGVLIALAAAGIRKRFGKRAATSGGASRRDRE